MRFASFHNHTTYSDGADAPKAFLPYARQAGVSILGFSDHYYKETPEATTAPDWALRLDALDAYFDDIEAVAATAPDIDIRAGLEFDWLDGSAVWLAPIAQDKRLDYTIGSVHFVGTDSIDLSRTFWENLTPDEINHLVRRYWMTVRDMAVSGLFDIAGHLDLYKKFNFYPTAPMDDVIEEALDAIEASQMAVELNTAGWRKDCRTYYPTRTILEACHKRELPLIISSDAHQASLVAADFTRALDEAYRAGYRSLATFKARERQIVPFA